MQWTEHSLCCVPPGNFTFTITRSVSDMTALVAFALPAADLSSSQILLLDLGVALLSVPFVPSFVQLTTPSGNRHFAVSLPYVYVSFSVRATFSMFSSVSFYDSNGIFKNLQSGALASPVSLLAPNITSSAVSVTHLQLLSLQDGSFWLSFSTALL